MHGPARRAAAASALRVHLLLIGALALSHFCPHIGRENLGFMVREAATTSHGHAREERSRTHVVCIKLVHGQRQRPMLDASQRLKLRPLRNALRMIAAPTVGSSRQAMYRKAFARLSRR